MKRIKITEQQLKKILESDGLDGPIVKGGVNRVNKQSVKTINNSDIQTFTASDMPDSQGIHEDDDFNIKDPLKPQSGLPNVPNTRMRNKRETNAPDLNEDIFSPELHHAIHSFIQNIWMNPSQKRLDKFFVENGITWGDITSYLTGVGILAVGIGGLYKVKNIFDRKFSEDEMIKAKEKEEEIENITRMVEKDPEAPWNQETTYEKKQRMQAKPDSGWKAEPKPFNPNRFKPGLEETEDDEYTADYYDQLGKRGKEPEPVRSMSKQIFKPIYMNYDILLAEGPDGMYVFYYSDIDRENLPNPEFELDMDDVADYLNDNYKTLKKGEGINGWESGQADLIKIDDELKQHLISLYSKDKGLISKLESLSEMTSAASSGAFTGAFGSSGSVSKNYSPDYTPAKQIGEIINDEDKLYGTPIEEMTVTGGDPTSSPQGQYTQPAIWAKDEANWAGNKRTQYPKGQFVTFDSCTKLNNNKKAQNGKCSQGAVDKVVKLRTTKDSVISKNIYETIAKKTGRTVEDVKKIIEKNINEKKKLVEDEQPSYDDLNNFYKDFMQKVKTDTEQARKFDIGFNQNELKDLIRKYVLTPFVLATLKLKYDIDLKNFYLMKGYNGTQHHKITRYRVSDNPIKPENGKILLEISIQIPKDIEFVEENTLMDVYFYLENRGKYKGISELVSARLTPDVEATKYKTQDLLQKIGNLIITKLPK